MDGIRDAVTLISSEIVFTICRCWQTFLSLVGESNVIYCFYLSKRFTRYDASVSPSKKAESRERRIVLSLYRQLASQQLATTQERRRKKGNTNANSTERSLIVARDKKKKKKKKKKKNQPREQRASNAIILSSILHNAYCTFSYVRYCTYCSHYRMKIWFRRGYRQLVSLNHWYSINVI